jgi:hypothetical protein
MASKLSGFLPFKIINRQFEVILFTLNLFRRMFRQVNRWITINCSRAWDQWHPGCAREASRRVTS